MALYLLQKGVWLAYFAHYKWLLSTHAEQNEIHCLWRGRSKNIKSPMQVKATNLAESSCQMLMEDWGLGCTLWMKENSPSTCVGRTVTTAAAQVGHFDTTQIPQAYNAVLGIHDM